MCSEPVDPQLAPYLDGLNVCDAVESFNKLADRLLAVPSSQQSYLSPASPSSCGWLSASSACSSMASSPAPSDRTSAYSTSSWSSFSGPASVASSRSSSCGSSVSKTRTSRNKCRKPVGERRQKNATAAERYRQKLKGQESSLADQELDERERNTRLRRDVEAKLTLYREFIALLAQNTTCYGDLDLAQMGSRSLASVLAQAQQPSTLLDRELNTELQAHLAHFQQIQQASSQQPRVDVVD